MPPEKNNKKNQPRFVALAGIGLQMGITIYVFSYIGKQLDQFYPNDKKIGTIVFTLIGVVVSFYYLLKQVNRLNRDDK